MMQATTRSCMADDRTRVWVYRRRTVNADARRRGFARTAVAGYLVVGHLLSEDRYDRLGSIATLRFLNLQPFDQLFMWLGSRISERLHCGISSRRSRRRVASALGLTPVVPGVGFLERDWLELADLRSSVSTQVVASGSLLGSSRDFVSSPETSA